MEFIRNSLFYTDSIQEPEVVPESGLFRINNVKIGNSKISGKGCFATEDIKQGSIVEKSPYIPVYKEQITEGHRLYNIIFGLDDHCYAIFLGWGSIYNHSDNNNVEWSTHPDDNYFLIEANRDIAEGEELTVSYGPDWLASREF